MNRLSLFFAGVAALLSFVSCQDSLSEIGSSLVDNDVTISVDSLVTDLHASSEWVDQFDARTSTKLLGRIAVPEYGTLACSFVTQLMCSTRMVVPDSIKSEDVDSLRMLMLVPRGELTGDSLAPQQLRVYELTKQLPSDISSTFDATGYYDRSSLLGSKSYTISNISMGDSAFVRDKYVKIPVRMPDSLGKELFTRYRANDPIFQWPQSFAQWFPGLYVEANFGNGCVANISNILGFLYWHRTERQAVTENDSTVTYKNVIVRDSTCLLASQPEVLSSNNIKYVASDKLKDMAAAGKAIVTSPGGYRVNISFPLASLIKRFIAAGTEMSVVVGLSLEIPARTISNDYGLTQAPHLLMIRKDELNDFFINNKIPDNITSFYAAYDSDKGVYRFSKMRDYFLRVLNDLKKGDFADARDDDFVLLPVSVVTEEVEGYNNVSTYVTSVSQYMQKPTMTELETDKATICFTFSSQVLK